MKIQLLFAGAALCLLSAVPAAAFTAAPPAAAAAPSHSSRLTMDDLLAAEGLGDAWFSPDGSRVLFVRSLPVSAVHERGLNDESTSRDRLLLADVAGGAPRQIGADLAPIHGRPWRPDGQGFLSLRADHGLFRLAYWDIASSQGRMLPGLPTSTFPAFGWAGSRIVYATVSEEAGQLRSGPQMLDRLDARWRKAWTSDEPQITVTSANPLFEPTAPAPGALMIADTATGDGHKIADGDFQSVQVSPDGRWVAAVRLAEPIKQAVSWYGRRGELQIFALRPDGVVLAHSYADLDLDTLLFSWSPTGDRLLIAGKPAAAQRSASRAYVIDVADGRARALATEGLNLLDPSASAGSTFMPMGWMGARPVVVAGRPGHAEQAAPPPGSMLDYGETSGMRYDLYDLAGVRPVPLTAFTKASVDNFMAPPGREEALVVADGALWRVSAKGHSQALPSTAGHVVALALGPVYPPPPTTTAYARDKAGERVSLLVQSAEGLDRRVVDLGSGKSLWTLPSRDFLAASPDLTRAVTKAEDGWASGYSVASAGSVRPLATVNQALNSRSVAPATRFTYDYKGKTLTGWVLTPAYAKPGAPLPAVVSVYGGQVLGPNAPTMSKPTAMLPIFSGQLLAAQGYAVVYPSVPLGKGADTDVMGALAEECVAAIDALAAKGIVDPKRVGVTGQSFGGFSTAAILARRSDRFRAGVAMAGVYDWSAAFGMPALEDLLGQDGRDHLIEVRMVEDGQIQLGSPPWKNRDAYVRNSPISDVEKMDAPLLLLHGDMDLAVTGLAGATRMYYALQQAGKHPALVHYWGEGHVAQSAWAMRDQFARITAWFDAYVKGDGTASSPGG